MNDVYSRTSIVLGKDNIEKIKKMHVAICGIGGVGSYVLEALARIGVGKITIIDKDVVDITNINRQIIALNSNVGENKVKVAKSRINDINSSIDVSDIMVDINDVDIYDIFNSNNVDYIVDSVDNVDAKIAIIKYSVENNIKYISCMGMANRINPLDIRVDDIYKTKMCALAKVMRKRLKKEGIDSLKVVYSIEEPKKNSENILGSVSFVPSVAGLVIASEVIKDMID